MQAITYLLFLRRLDELHTLEELKATRLKQSMERRTFPGAKTDLRHTAASWMRMAGADIHTVQSLRYLATRIFEWLRDISISVQLFWLRQSAVSIRYSATSDYRISNGRSNLVRSAYPKIPSENLRSRFHRASNNGTALESQS
jgi:hypothetical protein